MALVKRGFVKHSCLMELITMQIFNEENPAKVLI